MGFFSGLSLKKKLFAVFGMSVVFIAGIIATSVVHMVWMRWSAMEVYDKAVVEAQNVLTIRAGLESTRRALLQMALEKDEAGQRSALEAVNDSTELVDTQIAALAAKDPAPDVWKLKKDWELFRHTRDTEIIPRIRNGARGEALSMAMGLQEERFREFMAVSGRFMDRSNAEIANVRELVTVKFQRTIIIYSVISFAGFLAAAASILFLSRDIAGRFSKVLEGVERFKSGERLVKIDVQGTDEIGVLKDAMNTLFEQVHEDRIAQEQYIGIINWEKSEKERQRAELARSEERFRSMVETTNDFVWEVDEKGVYTYASPRVFDILGYTPSEVIGKTPFDLMEPEEAARVRAVFMDNVKASKSFDNFENRNVHKDGPAVILETSGMPFSGHDGAFAGYRGIDRDITRRKKADEEKAAMTEQLTHTEKLASMGQLSAGVAHEINNPLGYVRSNLNTLSEYMEVFRNLLVLYGELSKAYEKGEYEEIFEYRCAIEKLNREVDLEFTVNDAGQILIDSNDGISRISSIVKGLKDLSYGGTGETVCQDLNNCLKDALKISWHEVKNRAEVAVDLCGFLPVRCRPQQLTQVFLNVLMNAAQAVTEKGKITINTVSVNGHAVVEIADDGPGMSEEVRKKIFDPFFTTKPVGKGTGLGLSIAYNIIKEHGGTIEAVSRHGEGAKFRIKLPLADEAASAA
jgi:PAS domain S-box-containing protein